MKNVIIAASDAKYGDFLINHWLRSLKENVNLKNIDVVILNYELTKNQVSKLKKESVDIKKCKKDGNVAMLRFRDIAYFLGKKKYDQVLLTDSGDMIFQEDISLLFKKDKKHVRACHEELNKISNKTYIGGFFSKEDAKKMKKMIKGKKLINAGFMIGPSYKFKKMAIECYNMNLNKSFCGPDQRAINYILYRDGFKELNKKYNFIPVTNKNKFYVKSGVFYFENHKKIPVVHNAGGHKLFRAIKNFGYGTDRNKIKSALYYSYNSLHKLVNDMSRK